MRKVSKGTVVHCEVETLHELLSHQPSDWLTPFIRIASHRGEEAGREVRARVAKRERPPFQANREAVLLLGEPRLVLDRNAITIPMRWISAGYRALFSVFEGEIILQAIDDHTSELLIEGEYGEAGASPDDPDALAGDAAAEMGLRTLLDYLRTAIEAQLGTASLIDEAR
jgi:hypothetical protein